MGDPRVYQIAQMYKMAVKMNPSVSDFNAAIRDPKIGETVRKMGKMYFDAASQYRGEKNVFDSLIHQAMKEVGVDNPSSATIFLHQAFESYSSRSPASASSRAKGIRDLKKGMMSGSGGSIRDVGSIVRQGSGYAAEPKPVGDNQTFVMSKEALYAASKGVPLDQIGKINEGDAGPKIPDEPTVVIPAQSLPKKQESPNAQDNYHPTPFPSIPSVQPPEQQPAPQHPQKPAMDKAFGGRLGTARIYDGGQASKGAIKTPKMTEAVGQPGPANDNPLEEIVSEAQPKVEGPFDNEEIMPGIGSEPAQPYNPEGEDVIYDDILAETRKPVVLKKGKKGRGKKISEKKKKGVSRRRRKEEKQGWFAWFGSWKRFAFDVGLAAVVGGIASAPFLYSYVPAVRDALGPESLGAIGEAVDSLAGIVKHSIDYYASLF